jgi:hypothetical protein
MAARFSVNDTLGEEHQPPQTSEPPETREGEELVPLLVTQARNNSPLIKGVGVVLSGRKAK